MAGENRCLWQCSQSRDEEVKQGIQRSWTHSYIWKGWKRSNLRPVRLLKDGMVVASFPTARTSPDNLSIATTEGSLSTIPLPFTNAKTVLTSKFSFCEKVGE